MTNLHVQKLLYYAQGWTLGHFGRPLFDDSIEAWKLGPVVPDVYRALRKYGDEAIGAGEVQGAAERLTPEDRAIIESVWFGYRKYSAFGLSEQSHREKPWKDARKGLPDGSGSNRTITRDAMRAFFKEQIALNKARYPHLPTGAELEAGIAELEAGGGISLEELTRELSSD